MKKILFIFLSFYLTINAYAQNNIRGKVTDDSDKPLVGVSVGIQGTTIGTTTDVNGNYSIAVEQDAILKFSYLGFLSQEIKPDGKTKLDVILKSDAKGLDEVVVVGYGTQKKVTITGAVSSVDSKEIETTKTQNVQNMLTGKLPGVRVVQKTSEPGDFSNQFDIRGFGDPLVVIDGVPRGNLSRLDPNEIESISVLKDASAAIYGVRAANGVVLVTTKHGQPGKAKITYSDYFGYQEAIGLPKPVGAIDRFTLFNERTMHSVDNPTLKYTDEDFAPYLDGTKQSTDWYDLVMQKYAPQYQHNLSASGSSVDNKIDYFMNLGYANQQGFWKSNSLDYDRYNLRTNLNAQITNRLKASIRLNGIIEKKDNQQAAAWEVFKALWRATPEESYFANGNPEYLNHTAAEHPGALSDGNISGTHQDKNTWLQSQIALEYKVPYIDGLTAKGMFSYDNKFNDNSNYKKSYTEYTYDAASEAYITPFIVNGPDQLTRSFNVTPSTLMQYSLNYKNTFGKKHNVSALVLYEESSGSGDNFSASRELAFPLQYLFAGKSENQVAQSNAPGISKSTNKGLVGKFNYDYEGKYIGEFSFRYDGSSKFPVGKQWGFFPAGSIGWRLSEESFIKDNSSLKFINNLKVRASYGVLGDDRASSYQFISGYDYPYNGNSQSLASGYVFDDEFVNAIGFRSSPNPNITWYTAKILNLGLDADLWDGKLGITFEAFRRNRDGLLANRLVSLPGSFGTTLPQENLNSDQTSGLELALSHRSQFHQVGINISGNVALTRSKNIYVERGPLGSSYDNWRNGTKDRYNDIWFGYGYVGQYQTYDEIANYNVFTGRATLPGDYIYEDWNNDGVIDGLDAHPIATALNSTSTSASGDGATHNYPLLTFGFNVGLNYKGFDLNMLLQGGALSYVSYGEQLKAPLAFDGNALDVFLDRWHPVDSKKDPYDPSNQWIQGYYAYTGTGLNEDSRRSIQNGAYLRVKSAELGYSLPKTLLNKVGIQKVRFYVNAYNLFTFTGVKGVDPEHPSEVYGYLYPLNRTINFGTSINF